MSFNAKALVRQTQVPIAQLDGSAGTTFCTKWFYATVDTFATVATAGYFNGARAQLKAGDQIEVACTASNKGGLYQVTAVPAVNNVTVTPAVLA